MARAGGPLGLVWLLLAVAAGTAVVVAGTLALYPTDTPVAAAVPSSSPAMPPATPTPSASTSRASTSAAATAGATAGTDALGCPTGFTAAPDDHLLCPPDLGSSWRSDPAAAVRPVSETCVPAGSSPVAPLASSRVRALLGPGFDVVEQIRTYASLKDATAAFDGVRLWMLGCSSMATGLDVRDADTEIQPASLSAGFVPAQSWWVIQDRQRTGLVLLESGSSVIEVAVVPHSKQSGPPQAALVSAVARAALQWDTTRRPTTASPSAMS